MKKIIFIAVLFCSFLIQSNAQITFGVKGGVGLSHRNYAPSSPFADETHKKDFIIVPSIYGIVSMPISDAFLIRSGIGIDQKGYSYTYFTSFYISNSGNQTLTGYNDIVKCKLNYLEIPVSISYKLPFGQRKFEVFAGGSFGFNLGGHAEIDRTTNVSDFGSGGPSIPDQEYHYSADVHPGNVPAGYNELNYNNGIYSNKYNISLLFGCAYQIHSRILLGAEAQLGLRNIRPHDFRNLHGPGNQDNDHRHGIAKTQSYMLTVTYMIFQGKKSS